MIFLLAIIASFAASAFGFWQARNFVRRRLRFVDAVQSPFAPWIAAGAAILVAMPVTWILPIVGLGTAVGFGASVGMGVAQGAKDAKRGYYIDG